MDVERHPIDQLIPYAANARTHSAAQIESIVKSTAEFGWTVPVLVDNAGVIIAGHGRVLAAQQLGLEDAPVIRIEHLSPAQVQAYRIADNRLSELAGWDEELLAAEVRELMDADFDVTLTGFDLNATEELLTDNDSLDPSYAVPEPPADPIAQPDHVYPARTSPSDGRRWRVSQMTARPHDRPRHVPARRGRLDVAYLFRFLFSY